MLGARPESDERDVWSLLGGHGADVFDLDLACDHLVAERPPDRGDEREPVFALVRDQDPQVLSLAVAQELLQSVDCNSGCRLVRVPPPAFCAGCMLVGVRSAFKPSASDVFGSNS